MDAKLDLALARLQDILPLTARQRQCDPMIKGLHQDILRSFVSLGRILNRAEMAQRVDDLDTALETLKALDLVVFSAQEATSVDACCATTLCLEMIFLRDADIAARWLAEAPDSRERFTLPQAIEFGARFFSPLLS